MGAACGLGLLVWLLFGRTAFVNYDSAWSLDWMRGLVADGTRPDLERLFSPTPHPLSDLLSAVLTPLSGAGPAGGRGVPAETALIVLACFWLGALGVVAFRLGQAWFGTAAGVVATVLVLTREPVLSYGLRTYLDLPYAVFLLLALLAETRRPRGGARTLAWITLAGLLRPEAWLLAAAYVGYLAVWQVRAGGAVPAGHPRGRAWLARLDVRGLALLVGLALLAPLGWIVEGLVLTGDPLQALTGTQENAADLDRVTGVGSAVTVMPRRLGEIVREPVLLAAAGGVVLALALLRRRAVLGVAAGVAAGVAFFVLAAAGLPLLTRYLVFPATLLVVFAAAGLLGWRRLSDDHRWRRPWQAFAVVCLLAFVVFAPGQARRLDRLQAALALQQRVIGDLRATTRDVVVPTFAAGDACAARGTALDIALPNHRAVPQTLLWLGTDPLGPRGDGDAGRPPAVGPMTAGQAARVVLLPSSDRVARGFILDKADGRSGLPRPPAGVVRAGTRGTWTVYGRDAACASALRARLGR